jgi:DNA-directed RNA polymerase alpha subunit
VDNDKAKLEIEMSVARGRGCSPAEGADGCNRRMPVDAIWPGQARQFRCAARAWANHS